MSAQADVLAVLDRQLRDRAERANRYRKNAEKSARKSGEPQITADRMAAYTDLQLVELRQARAAVAALIAERDALAQEVAALRQQPAPVVDDARMARALWWLRDVSKIFPIERHEHLPAIEEAIAAYDPHCGARTVRVVDVLVAVRHEIEAAKHELDTVTATDDAQSDGIGCAENALDRALAILAGAQGVQS